MLIKAVIGANYGDEGKGLVTEWLCRNSNNPIVVLNNGGPQRGHTIELKNGTRHVFHHFGSGTLIDVPSYYTDNYFVNPFIFVQEYIDLKQLGCNPVVYCDPNCQVVLPVHVAINQMLETARADNRHGSVGQGIWEAKLYSPISLGGLLKLDRNHRKRYIERINSIYPAIRFKQIKDEEGIDLSCDDELFKLFTNDGFTEHWLDDLEAMQNLIKGYVSLTAFKDNTLIFENGQGLLLDESKGIHATPSKTGLNGVLDCISNYNLENVELEPYYVSRTYITRHGAGDFPEKDDTIEHFEDLTNHPNDWQGTLRYGRLNTEELISRIEEDSAGYDYKIVMTHANEMPVTCPCVNYVSATKYSEDVRANEQSG